ncbi:MAG: hypothetical protein IBX55_22105 [Methyloprofundus sp.]|nr:hypothetical protein [Methyloprofundus sp.]
MEYSALYEKYYGLLSALRVIIEQSQERVIGDEPDVLFASNINFFVKSYLINICTYLEAYLQDVAFEHASRITERLMQAKIPHNFLYWRLSKDTKEKDWKFENASYKCEKKELSDVISGNPGKTIAAFRSIGVDLISSDSFSQHTDLVGSIVSKRNSIIHHNDDASDISFSDLLENIDVFLEYMQSIKELLCAENFDASDLPTHTSVSLDHEGEAYVAVSHENE